MAKTWTKENEEYYVELQNIRDSGVCNMFGATPYLMEEFQELNEEEATKILSSWMNECVEFTKYYEETYC